MPDLIDALDWEKSRLSHQLTRMEKRGFVQPTSGPSGRRTAITLTGAGLKTIEHAVTVHGQSVRQYFLEMLSPEHEAAIRDWCTKITRNASSYEVGRHSERPVASEIKG